ncbi:MAG TPA: AAA family ATPase [Blastocatellia bacterium]
MALRLTNFRIRGLHDGITVDIPIEDNRLVLVGENGSGKTTIINLLYFLLSRQWHRLARYKFTELSVTIDGSTVSLIHQDLYSTGTARALDEALGMVPPGRRETIETLLKRLRKMHRIPYTLLADISDDLDLPMDYLQAALVGDEALQPTLFDDARALDSLEAKLKALVLQQLLYLPTYRRIEQDLESIFPGSDFDQMIKRRGIGLPRGDRGYIELVEFRMQDVDQRIEQKMSALKDSVRNKLDKLTGSYLREVITGEYVSVDLANPEELRAEAIEPVLSRVGEDLLPEPEKNRLRIILRNIVQTNRIDEEHRVIAHFLLKLLDLHNAQQTEEAGVRTFVNTCNRYLSGKRLAYDNRDFRIDIELDSLENSQETNQTIKMKHLSSGEKQIVSLFSHLFLSGASEFLVLIDEPELSLSVPWQKTFLPDITETTGCVGLIAVTHSPFIFENVLDRYTHSINEYVG